MEQKFWLDKWSKNEIGFHEQSVHPMLASHWSEVIAGCDGHKASGVDITNVFVPLCGKSKDLIWLREQGHHVYGSELSEIAVEAFYTENNISFSKSTVGPLACYDGDNITLWCGDYFSLQPSMLPPIALFYDRAAFIALAPTSRKNYLEHLAALLASTALGLLVTIEYSEGLLKPPPHSISQQTVEATCLSNFSCEPLGSNDAEAKGKPCTEHALLLSKKDKAS